MERTAPAQPTDPGVEDELDRLATLPIARLRVRYQDVFRTEPPKAFGPDLLRRSIYGALRALNVAFQRG